MKNSENEVEISRAFKNCFGQDIMVSMDQDAWNLFDWGVGQGWPMNDWVMEMDALRKAHENLGDLISGELWRLVCTRYKHGHECPEPHPPHDYEGFLQGVERGEIEEAYIDSEDDKTHEDMVSRPVVLSGGAVEIAEMPRKYWLHIEVLVQLGTNFRNWAIDANERRLASSDEVNFSDFMMTELEKSENQHFLINSKIPLFINPDGYEKPTHKVWDRARTINRTFSERKVTTALGERETVRLSDDHWKHFDWLADQKGLNMDEWTADVDIGRHKHKGFNISLEAYLEMQLVQDEARRHRSGELVPLFINPDHPL